MLPTLLTHLRRPVDAAALAYFRIAFGLLMVAEMLRYLAGGRVRELWIEPTFHFKYLGFGWVEPLPGDGMIYLAVALAVAALLIALGLFYRLAAAVFALGFTYLFLIDQVKFMNHFYLICLLAWVTVFIPANAAFALDNRRRRKPGSTTTPAWPLLLLRFQLAVVYIYGGIAKLNADWLRGEPMRTWLAERAGTPVFGTFFQTGFAPYFFSYGGLLFDLLVVPTLLWKKTRTAAFVVAALFHLANSQLFTIGIFPWLGIALTALFFEPSTLRRLFRAPSPQSPNTPTYSLPKILVPTLAVYAALQVLVPFRHHLYPGNVSWTEEGHRFSWHMMLRSKRVDAAALIVKHPATGQAWKLDPAAYLTAYQTRKMLARPDMLQQFATHIHTLMADAGHPGARVHAVINTRLNGRAPALLIDPETDLAATRRSLAHATWILPLPKDPAPTNHLASTKP